MPFKSKAQLRKFAILVKQGKLSQAEFDKWVHETHDIKSLPNKLRSKRKPKRKK